MSKKNEEIEQVEIKPTTLVATNEGEFCNLLDTAKFNQMWRVAQLFAATGFIPDRYKNNASECFIAIQMAVRVGVDPMMWMQNTYVVHGTPGMEGKLAIALINKNGPFDGPVQWKFEGEGKTRKCTAFGKLAKGGGVCEASVDWAMVVAEGWDKNTKWRSMPDLMFRYRSASFLGRLFCPEVLMGMQTVDEIVDVKGDPYAEPKQVINEASGVSGLEARLSQPESPQIDEPELAVEPEAQEPDASDGPTEPETGPPEILRFYCKSCDREFAHKKNKKCPHCLSTDVIDRNKKTS